MSVENLKEKNAVVDLYNTLIRNEIRLHPYKTLYKSLTKLNKGLKEEKSRYFFKKAMTTNLYIEDIIKEEVKYNREIIEKFNLDIKEELNSIIYNEDLIKELNENYDNIVLLSNLSKEYEEPIKELEKKLKINSKILSFEVGFVKPDIDIFREAAKSINKLPNECIMYGDNLKLDIEGAELSGYKKSILVEKWWD